MAGRVTASVEQRRRERRAQEAREALGARAKEALLQADAAVRGAANVLTLGYGDTLAAGLDSLVGAKSPADVQSRFQANAARERARTAYDAQHRRGAQAAGEIAGGVIGLAGLGPMEGPLAATPRLAGAAARTAREGAAILTGGALAGLANQKISDQRDGRPGSWRDDAGAALGGALGAAALPAGPARAGAVMGASTSVAQDLLHGRPVSYDQAAESGFFGNLLGGAGGVVGRNGSNALSMTAKGKLGEALGWTRGAVNGELRTLGPKKRVYIPNSQKHFYPDATANSPKSVSGVKYYEDKFGRKPSLSSNQKLAQGRFGPDFVLNHFTPADIGKLIGLPAAAAAPQGARKRP